MHRGKAPTACAKGGCDGIKNNEKKPRRLCRPRPGSLIRAAADGSALRLAADYIEVSLGRDTLPNIAGFCRSLGVGVSEFEGLRRSHPDVHGILLAAFEDVALNADVPASILSLYLRGRLDYNDRARVADDSPAAVIFEHDVMRDGE